MQRGDPRPLRVAEFATLLGAVAGLGTITPASGFVLPGPSGANNGMPLALRTALWADLADFLEASAASPLRRA